MEVPTSFSHSNFSGCDAAENVKVEWGGEKKLSRFACPIFLKQKITTEVSLGGGGREGHSNSTFDIGCIFNPCLGEVKMTKVSSIAPRNQHQVCEYIYSNLMGFIFNAAGEGG